MTDLRLSATVAKVLPRTLRLEVVLFGVVVHAFEADREGGEEAVLSLNQIVSYEEPDVLADKLASLPYVEFRVLGHAHVNGAIGGGDQRQLLATAQHDLAGMAEDLVDAALPLEGIPSRGAEFEASQAFGDLVVSIVAESGPPSALNRAEGGGGLGSSLLYGRGYGYSEQQQQAAAKPTQTGAPLDETSRAGVCPGIGFSTAEAPPPRPRSRSASPSAFSSGLADGGLHGPGSVLSFGASSSRTSESRKRYVETPVGFQYKSIPARFLTPRGSEGDDDARSETGSIGGGGSRPVSPASATSRGRSRSTSPWLKPPAAIPASLSAVSLSQGGGINSHALAEGFWSQWRERQLPPGVPAPGKIAVVVEVRYDTGNMTTRHDSAKYERYAQSVSSLVKEVLGDAGSTYVVPAGREAHVAGPIAHWQTAHGARLGAFEVQICYHQSGFGTVSELVHSKLLAKKWPAIRPQRGVSKLEIALRSFTRTIRLRPHVLTAGPPAGTIPAHPLPRGVKKAGDAEETPSAVRVRMGSDLAGWAEVKCKLVSIGPIPSGPRNLAGKALSKSVADADDADRLIVEFMRSNEVVFHGAGEPSLPSVTKAWDVLHMSAERRAKNVATLKGVARILLKHPTVRCEVHGETGKASSVPKPLAKHLSLDPVGDVAKAMNVLARSRAQACADFLIDELRVPKEQLFVSATGMGGAAGVSFRPTEGTDGAGGGTLTATVPASAETVSADQGADQGSGELQGLEFQLMRGCEAGCVVYIGEPDESPCGYANFETPLVSLMNVPFAFDSGHGMLDVPVKICLKERSFELPIEFVKAGSRVLASNGAATIRSVGERSDDFNLPAEIEIHATNGRHILKWSGYVEAFEVVAGGATDQPVCHVWPGRHGVKEPVSKGGVTTLPSWKLSVDGSAVAARAEPQPSSAGEAPTVGTFHLQDAPTAAQRPKVLEAEALQPGRAARAGEDRYFIGSAEDQGDYDEYNFGD